MSDPKVPSWMSIDAGYKSISRWYGETSAYVSYYEGEKAIVLDGEFTAQQLRELADLIDSCQAGYIPEK